MTCSKYQVCTYKGKEPSRIWNYVTSLLYRTSGVIFFIDYCTATRDTQKGWREEKETLY